MMEAAADIDANAILQGAFGGQDGAARVQQEGVDHLRRIGDLHLQLFARAERPLYELVDVMRRVHQHDLGFAGRLRHQEVAGLGDAFVQQTLANQTVFVGAKDVLADGEEIFFAIDQLEGQHGAYRLVVSLLKPRLILDRSQPSAPFVQVWGLQPDPSVLGRGPQSF